MDRDEQENIELRAENKALRDRVLVRDNVILFIVISILGICLALSMHDTSSLSDGTSQSIYSQ